MRWGSASLSKTLRQQSSPLQAVSQPLQARIYTLAGQQMMHTQMKSEFLQWEIGQLPAGTYVLLLQSEGKHWAGKITLVQN